MPFEPAPQLPPQDPPQDINPNALTREGLPLKVTLPTDLANYVVQGVQGFPVPTLYELVNKARAADFFFDVQFFDQVGADGYVGIDTVYSGQGVADIDHVLELFGRYVKIIVKIDLGLGDTQANYAISKTDIETLRALYVFFWGETAKPDVWGPPLYANGSYAPAPPWNDTV